MKIYHLRDHEVSEDTAIFAEAWYEAVEDLYGSFSEFMVDMVRRGTKPYLKGPRGEKASALLKEKGWSKSRTFDIPKELFERLEEIAEEKGLSVDDYVSEELIKFLTKSQPSI